LLGFQVKPSVIQTFRSGDHAAELRGIGGLKWQSQEFNRVVIERLGRLPKECRKTLTRDRRKENLGWQEIEEKLETDVFFAYAYSSYERSSNENGNGLIQLLIQSGLTLSLFLMMT